MGIRQDQCNKVCRIIDDYLANRPRERDELIVAVRTVFKEADRKTDSSLSDKPTSSKDEPTISKMEQVDKDINVRSKDEPMKTTDYCDICKQDMCKDCIADATNPYCVPSHYEINYEPKDEPQTDDFFRQPTEEELQYVRDYIDSISVPAGVSVFELMDEPQTELVNDSPILAKDLVDDEFNPYDEECMRCKHLKLKCEFVPSYCKYEPRDEPQFDKDINVRSKAEPQTERSSK